MIIHCLYNKLVPIKDLVPHPKNRNKHPKEQIERLAKVLNYQGWRYPIKVSNQSGFITSGHGRLLAASHNGWTEVPVNYQDYETSDQEYMDVQSDNAIALWAELDLAGIQNDIKDLPNIDVDLLGIKDFVLEPVLDEKKDGKQLNSEQNDLLNEAWSQWCSEQLINISVLEKLNIFFQSLTPGALKIYFLKSLFLDKPFPRFVTTARQYHRMQCSGDGDKGSIIDLLQAITDNKKLAERLRKLSNRFIQIIIQYQGKIVNYKQIRLNYG